MIEKNLDVILGVGPQVNEEQKRQEEEKRREEEDLEKILQGMNCKIN